MRPMRMVLILAILAACGSKATPPVGNTERGGSAAQVVPEAAEDCTARIEDWKPGNHDRHAFEDPVTNLHGYKNGAGKIVIAATYRAGYEFGPGGVAAVIDGTTPFLFIDPSGKVIAHAYASDNGPDYFQEGHARIVANKKVGFMTDRGQITVPPQFDGAASFCHGKVEVELDGETYYIDKQGKRTTPPPTE